MKKAKKPTVDESGSKTNTQRCKTEQGNVNKPEPHEWKKGTVLILGEEKLGSNGSVMVRSFPGSTIHDLHNYYMKSLLKKKPCKVILHIGTNEASISGASSDSILHYYI